MMALHIPDDAARELLRIPGQSAPALLHRINQMFQATTELIDAAERTASAIQAARLRGVSRAELRTHPVLAELERVQWELLTQLTEFDDRREALRTAVPHTIAAMNDLSRRIGDALALIERAVGKEV